MITLNTLNREQLNESIRLLNIVEKQINPDPTEKSSALAFDINKIDVDGDFGFVQNQFDGDKLRQCLSWLAEQLGWELDQIQFVEKNQEKYIEALNPNLVVEYLNQHYKNSESIEQASVYPKACFMTMDTNNCTNIGPKGLAVMADYYSKKDSKRNDTFIGDDSHLGQLMDHLQKAEDGVRFVIELRMGATHWVPILIFKKNGFNYFVEMDSEGTSKDYGGRDSHCVKTAIEASKLDLTRTFFYRSKNILQSGPNNCGIFTNKLARMLEASEDILAEIAPLTVQEITFNSGLRYREYLTPPRFEYLVQSKKDHRQYLKALQLKLDAVDEQALYDASFGKIRQTEGVRVKTGKTEHNMTVHYFKDKYAQKVLTFVDRSDFESLKQIVDQYSLYMLDESRMNKTKLPKR